jgi:hypothetical protein
MLILSPIVGMATRAVGGGLAVCPEGPPRHGVKAGQVRGQQGWLWRGCGSQCTRTAPRRQPAVANSAGGLSPRPRALHQRRAQAVWRAGRLRVGIEPARCPRARCQASAPGKAVVVEVDERWHFRQNTGPTAGSGRLLIVIQAASLLAIQEEHAVPSTPRRASGPGPCRSNPPRRRNGAGSEGAGGRRSGALTGEPATVESRAWSKATVAGRKLRGTRAGPAWAASRAM